MASNRNERSNPYRCAFQTAVAAVVKESGYTDADPDALSSLVELALSFMSQIAKSSKHYSELANRSQEMVSDISFALIDAGVSLEGLKFYSDRHINKPSVVGPSQREHEVQAGKPLVVNMSSQQPQYVHDNLPSFPDRHTYIHTAAQRMPSTDYQLVREKAANQKKTAETALTRFIAKTGDSDHYCDDINDPINKAFPLIACKHTTLSYLSALLQKDENEFELFNLLHETGLPNTVGEPTNAKRLKTEPQPAQQQPPPVEEQLPPQVKEQPPQTEEQLPQTEEQPPQAEGQLPQAEEQPQQVEGVQQVEGMDYAEIEDFPEL